MGTVAALNPSALGSLKNYSATSMDNGVIIVVSVHSPTNWQESIGGTTGGLSVGGTTMLHIKNRAYVEGSPKPNETQPVWYENPEAAGAYANSPYPGAVSNFLEFAKTANVTITRQKRCAVAGVVGQVWTISAPATKALKERESACIADRSGVLLRLRTTASGSAVPGGSVLYTFVIDQIGGTPAITVPPHTYRLG